MIKTTENEFKKLSKFIPGDAPSSGEGEGIKRSSDEKRALYANSSSPKREKINRKRKRKITKFPTSLRD